MVWKLLGKLMETVKTFSGDYVSFGVVSSFFFCDFSFNSDDFWDCAVRYQTGPENHQSGSCKMGPYSDALAVVDSELQIHGIDGLRVMDASIMPSVVSGNTHATVVMIAEKGANHIKKKWLHASKGSSVISISREEVVS